MLRATSVTRKAAVKADRIIDSVTLDAEERHRRRAALTGDGGLDFLLDLDRTLKLDDGDGLKLEDGRLIAVKAKAENLIEVRAGSAARLLRIAWHIGNRHAPAECDGDAIYVADDHVMAEMLRGLGAVLTPVVRPFRPEGGAYDGDGSGQAHGHVHGHVHGPGCGHDHAHDHSHDHSHGHDHAHDHAHTHGDASSHGHGHAQGHGHKHG